MAVRGLHSRHAANDAMFAVLNTSYAVVRYGGEIVIANIIRNDVVLMKADNFHKMYANVRVGVGNVSVESQTLVQVARQATIFSSRHRIRAGWST